MNSNHQKTALALMASGALPFIGAAYLTLPGASLDGVMPGQFIIIAYGAVILSFLGGIRWGAALQDGPPAILFASVLPSLAGFASLLLALGLARISLTPSIALLIAGFASQAAWDYVAPGTLPQWFVKLRMVISAIVIICLSVTLIF